MIEFGNDSPILNVAVISFNYTIVGFRESEVNKKAKSRLKVIEIKQDGKVAAKPAVTTDWDEDDLLKEVVKVDDKLGNTSEHKNVTANSVSDTVLISSSILLILFRCGIW